MRATSPVWPYAIAAAHRTVCRVTAYRAGADLGVVPVLTGEITYDATATLQRRLKLAVPARSMDGATWDPGDSAGHPLAVYGQRLHVRAGIELPGGGMELMDHGWYLVTGWALDETGHALDVSAVDLVQLLADARHYTIEAPPKGATYRSEFARLADKILPTKVGPRLPATKVHPATVWDRDRVKNLDDLCDAWGARWWVDDTGTLCADVAYPDLTPTTPPAIRLTGGSAGTLTGRQREGTRERLYNAVIATGKAGEQGEPAPWGKAEITDPRSPIRVGGPYGRKPRFLQSDLLATSAQCTAAARALLPRASSIGRSDPVAVVPDAALELGDVAEIVTGGAPYRGRVTAITLPLHADGGAMQVTVSNAPDLDDES